MHFVLQGVLIALFPLLLAFFYGILHKRSMWDEGSGGGGYIWMCMITFPLGILWVLLCLCAQLIFGGSRRRVAATATAAVVDTTILK
jgi:hypothetical protein